MISFIYQRKDKGSFNVCEDSLTSIVFDTLKYLPSELLYRIIRKSLFENKLPASAGELISISFWEKWDATDTRNTNFVEPDVFLRFPEFDIIVEAKRYDEFQQNEIQLRNEIIAYHNEYFDDNKQLYLVQLGGLHNKEDHPDIEHKDRRVKICKTNWTQFLNEIDNENRLYKNHHLSTLRSYSRILEDCIKGLELHQFYKKKWLDDLEIISLNCFFKSDLFRFSRPSSNSKLLENLTSDRINQYSINNEFDYARY